MLVTAVLAMKCMRYYENENAAAPWMSRREEIFIERCAF